MSSDHLTAIAADSEFGVVSKLSTLDRFLPVWIIAAMALGLVGGRLVSGLGAALNAISIDGVSLPIALGLLVMMYPVLAKVRYDRLDTVTARSQAADPLAGAELDHRSGVDVRPGLAAAA